MKEDISLCEVIDEKTTKINSLWSQLEQERKEKLQLCDSVREVEVISRSHEHATEDLRAEVVDLNDRNRRYWQELQDLRFESQRGCTKGSAGSSR